MFRDHCACPKNVQWEAGIFPVHFLFLLIYYLWLKRIYSLTRTRLISLLCYKSRYKIANPEIPCIFLSSTSSVFLIKDRDQVWTSFTLFAPHTGQACWHHASQRKCPYVCKDYLGSCGLTNGSHFELICLTITFLYNVDAISIWLKSVGDYCIDLETPSFLPSNSAPSSPLSSYRSPSPFL